MYRITVWGLIHGTTRRSLASSNGWSRGGPGQGLAWPWSSASSKYMADASGSNLLARDAGVRSVLLSHNHRVIASRGALRQPGSTNAAPADTEGAGDGWLIALEAYSTGLQGREMVQVEDRELLVHEALKGGIQLESSLRVGSLPCLGNQLIDACMIKPRSGEFVGRCTGEELPREPAIRIPAIAARRDIRVEIPVATLF